MVYRYDDTNPEGRTARMLADRAIQRAAGRADPVPATDPLVREAGSRYIDFLVPGLVGLGIMSNAVWGLGFSIVDSRRRKLTKRLIATPMSRTYYLLSYLFWRMIMLVVEVGVPIGFGALAFGVPVRGRLVDLVVICVLASLPFSALALLIACRARTIEAVSGLMNLVQVPMWILSGVFFSAQRFPDAVQPIIRALPLTAVIDALRAHMLQGARLVQLVPQLARAERLAGRLLRARAEAVPLALSGSERGLWSACSEREVGHDDDDHEKHEPCDAHQPGASDMSRSFRLDAGDCRNGGDEHGDAEPCEPTHDERQHTRCENLTTLSVGSTA